MYPYRVKKFVRRADIPGGSLTGFQVVLNRYVIAFYQKPVPNRRRCPIQPRTYRNIVGDDFISSTHISQARKTNAQGAIYRKTPQRTMPAAAFIFMCHVRRMPCQAFGRTVITGIVAVLTTFSATEPKSILSMPVRPWVPITMISILLLVA